jgi:hypothetical protein
MSDDDGTFTIRLVDGDDNPISGRKVYVDYGGMRGVGHEYTGDDGRADFPTLGYDSVSTISSYRLEGLFIQQVSEELSSGESIYDGAEFTYTIVDGSDDEE